MNITVTLNTEITLPDTGRMWKINDDWSESKGRSGPRQILALTLDADGRGDAIEKARGALIDLRDSIDREITRLEKL